MRRSSFRASFLSVAIATTACGGSVSEPGNTDEQDTTPSGGDDTGTPGEDTDIPPGDDTDVPTDTTPPGDGGVDPHGTPSDTYPAFAPDLPILQFGGGTLLKTPVIVTITYDTDTKRADFEAFGDKIGSTEYWKAVTAEYGVGPAVSGAANHVHIATAPPASVSDRDVRNMIAANAGTSWPAATDNSIYVFYAHPSSIVASFGGRDLCKSGVGGYHSSTTVGGKRVSYAVLPQCAGGSGAFAVTSASSHEMAEAVTDPFQSSPGYYGFDNPHLAWELWQDFNVENGDACEFYVDSFYTETESAFAYSVQRQWSNANAKVGKSPCAPVDPTQPYFNVSPEALESIKVDLSSVGSSSSFATKGYHIGVGESKTIVVDLWSEAKRTPWSLKAVEGNPILGPVTPSNLTVSIDLKTGQNGQKAFVTVKVNSASKTKYELVSVESYVFGVAHYMPLLITQL